MSHYFINQPFPEHCFLFQIPPEYCRKNEPMYARVHYTTVGDALVIHDWVLDTRTLLHITDVVEVIRLAWAGAREDFAKNHQKANVDELINDVLKANR